jgi:Fic family protein
MQYPYQTLQLVEPDFDSFITDLIIDLDHLRRKKLKGSTRPEIFFQLKGIFHLLESLESARIEGNRTTLADLIDQRMGESSNESEEFEEIANVEEAIRFIDQNIHSTPINRAFIAELHKRVVGNLSPQREGDATPGIYRKKPVKIAKASHVPPDYLTVDSYMEELFAFINSGISTKYDLLKTALAHHRFAWIHPFSNGNGRTVRLFTYAMLVKQGFNVNVGRILNPTAVFCNDRQKYYDSLSGADTGSKTGLLAWCEYVLGGLKAEIEKIDNLLNHKYLSTKILLPALQFSLDRKIITSTEEKILRVAVDKQVFQASDVGGLFPGKLPSDLSRLLRGLKDKKMIVPIEEGARKYHLHFFNSYLLRGVIEMLARNGFIPLRETASGSAPLFQANN